MLKKNKWPKKTVKHVAPINVLKGYTVNKTFEYVTE